MLTALAAALLIKAPTTAGPAKEDGRLAAISSDYFAQRNRTDAVALTTPAGDAARLRADRALLARLSALSPARLSADGRVDAALLANALRYEVWRHDGLQERRWDVQRWDELVRDALAEPDAPPAGWRPRLLAATRRFQRAPLAFRAMRAQLDPARTPRQQAELVAAQSAHLLDGMVEPLHAHEGALRPGERRAFRRAAARLRAAAAEHQRWLEHDLTPNARGDFRLGAKLYDRKAQFELLTSLSRPQIEAAAQAAITDLRSRMYAVAVSMQPSEGGPASPATPQSDAQLDAVVRDALARASAVHPTRTGFVDEIRRLLGLATGFVRERDLVSLPPYGPDVELMPPSMQGIVPAFFQANGGHGLFAVSPLSPAWSDARADAYLKAHNTYDLANLVVHEAMPGHFVQTAHQGRSGSEVRRTFGSRAFAEGWAVYAQRMMVRAGFLDRDPLYALTELRWRLSAACSAVLDIGVHTRGWSRDQAMRFAEDRCFQSDVDAEGRWRRLTLTSTQLLTYFVGYTEHAALRREIERLEGSRFDLKRYHDRVLSYGMPPVRMVRKLMLASELPARRDR